MRKNQVFEPENYDELKEINKLQAESKVLPGGEYGFEKEGFEDDDFSGAEEGKDSDPEENWGEVEDFGDEGMVGAEVQDEEDFDDTGKTWRSPVCESSLPNVPDINLKNDEHMQTADSQLLEFKIQKILKILANFNTKREEGVQRSQYVDDLKTLFCKLYGYNTELMDLFMDIFGPAEVKILLD